MCHACGPSPTCCCCHRVVWAGCSGVVIPAGYQSDGAGVLLTAATGTLDASLVLAWTTSPEAVADVMAAAEASRLNPVEPPAAPAAHERKLPVSGGQRPLPLVSLAVTMHPCHHVCLVHPLTAFVCVPVWCRGCPQV